MDSAQQVPAAAGDKRRRRLSLQLDVRRALLLISKRAVNTDERAQ